MTPSPKGKKPGLALVIAMGKGDKGKKSDAYSEPDGDESTDELPEAFQAAADELSDTLKLDDSERDGFASALYAAIAACK